MDNEQNDPRGIWHLKQFANLRHIAPDVQLSDEFYERMAEHMAKTMQGLLRVEVSKQTRENLRIAALQNGIAARSNSTRPVTPNETIVEQKRLPLPKREPTPAAAASPSVFRELSPDLVEIPQQKDLPLPKREPTPAAAASPNTPRELSPEVVEIPRHIWRPKGHIPSPRLAPSPRPTLSPRPVPSPGNGEAPSSRSSPPKQPDDVTDPATPEFEQAAEGTKSPVPSAGRERSNEPLSVKQVQDQLDNFGQTQPETSVTSNVTDQSKPGVLETTERPSSIPSSIPVVPKGPATAARSESAMSGVLWTDIPQGNMIATPPATATPSKPRILQRLADETPTKKSMIPGSNIMMDSHRRTPSGGFAEMSDPKRIRPDSPKPQVELPKKPEIKAPDPPTPSEIIVAQLENCKHSSDVVRLLGDEQLATKAILAIPKFPTDGTYTEKVIGFVRDSLVATWKHEVDQASAAWLNRNRKKKTVHYQPLHKFCVEPEGYKEESIVNSLRCIREARQQAVSADLRYRGLESWISPLIDKRQQQLMDAGKEEETAYDLAFELVVGGIGEPFPSSWHKQVEAQVWTENSLQLVVATGKAAKKSSGRMFKMRRKNKYRCMQLLREKGLEFIFLSTAGAFDTILGDITKPEDTLIPCAEHFRDFVKMLSSRAWSGEKGDYSGRSEVSLQSIKAGVYGVVSQADKALWNNEAGFWSTIGDCVLYNDTHVVPVMGTLPSSTALFKYGYLGQFEENMAWAIIPVQNGSGIRPCASRKIDRGCFVGVLPSKCMFRPDEAPKDNLIRGPENGLYMDEKGCKGLMSYMKRSENYEHANVVATWDRYADAKAPQLISWRLLLFACRPIRFMQPLVLWRNMEGLVRKAKTTTASSVAPRVNQWTL